MHALTTQRSFHRTTVQSSRAAQPLRARVQSSLPLSLPFMSLVLFLHGRRQNVIGRHDG